MTLLFILIWMLNAVKFVVYVVMFFILILDGVCCQVMFIYVNYVLDADLQV
jgi:hypothetical protein